MPSAHSSPATSLRLTPTELRVAQRVVNGETNTQIGAALDIKPGTVSNILWIIGAKTGATSRPERAHALLTSGLVSPPAAPDTPPSLMLGDWSLLDPGLVPTHQWHARHPHAVQEPCLAASYAAIAVHPAPPLPDTRTPGAPAPTAA